MFEAIVKPVALALGPLILVHLVYFLVKEKEWHDIDK